MNTRPILNAFILSPWDTDDFDDIVGKNCRFLQGPGTEKSDVERIADAIKKEKDVSVNLVNYKKDGTKFINEVSLLPSCVCFGLHVLTSHY